MLPVLKTNKAVCVLDEYHLYVKIYVISKVLPDETDGNCLAERRARAQKYLKEIDETCTNQSLIVMPLLQGITTTGELDRFREYYEMD